MQNFERQARVKSKSQKNLKSADEKFNKLRIHSVHSIEKKSNLFEQTDEEQFIHMD